MSYANGRRIRRQKLRTVAKTATKAMGCTCHPDYRVGTARGIDNAKVLHESSCPLYDFGSAYVWYQPGDFGGCDR